MSMSMEGTSRARKPHLEGSGKKSKKGLKRKVCLEAENENAEDIYEVADLDEAVLNMTGSDGAQSVPPLQKSKKKEKVVEDVKQQEQNSREKTQDSVQQRSLKRRKRVKFNLESSNTCSDQEERESVPELDEAVLNITGSEEAQSVSPLKKNKKKEKVREDVKQQVQEKTQDNVQQRSSKQRKHVKFNLESSNMSLDQEERESMEEDVDDYPMLVQGIGTKEENEFKKPNDTTWVQKASWKSLVGETGRVNFSLGSMLGHDPSMLPGGNIKSISVGPAQPSMDVQSINNVSAWIEGPSSAPLIECSSQSNGLLNFSHVKNTPKLIRESETQSDSTRLNHQSVRTPGVQNGLKRDPQKFEGTKHEDAESLDLRQAVKSDDKNGVEKVCRFMRSDNYEQEWLEAKRAVKDIFKRSRKDALRSMKMFHKKHNQ